MMSYQVLARKWRPRDFSTLVGQAHVRIALTNALNQGRLHHAYLFSGTRGVGKTTIARILAKCFNCDAGVSATPCLKCPSCIALEDGTCPDFIEVDAASHTKVEDIRELLSNVAYQPIQCRFKIYAIDEAHMLSNHSFNALLKTLEEPPAHVKFLFATTEPKRLPITILSRCLQFNLKSLSSAEITHHLAHILNTESIPFEMPALQQIATQANGSIRDALSTLDQAINFTNGQLNSADVSVLLGTLALTPLLELLEHLVDGDTHALWLTLEHINEFNPDYHHVLSDLTHMLYQIQLIQLFPEERSTETTFVHEYCDQLTLLAQKMSKETVQLYYQIALLGQRDLGLHRDTSIGFNMTILRMLSFTPIDTIDASPIMRTTSPSPQIQPPSSQQHKNSDNVAIPSAPEPAKNTEKAQNISQNTHFSSKPAMQQRTPAHTTPTAPPVPSIELEPHNWPRLLKALPLTGLTAALAAQCTLAHAHNNTVELHLNKKHAALNSAAQAKLLGEALSHYTQKPITLKITLIDHAAPLSTAAEKAASVPVGSAKEIITDPNIQEWATAFNAKVTPREDVGEL